MSAALTTFGGRLVQPQHAQALFGSSVGEVWDFGYRLPAERNADEDLADKQARQHMQPFGITGSWNDDPEIVGLWECAKAANGGKHFIAFWQQTGSCVGNGGGQAVWYTSAVEVVRLGDPEQVLLPFYLLPYGRSRFIGGIRGRGNGSFGSAFAKAIMTDGILPANTAGLPPAIISENDGITWGRNAELEWSDGARIDQKWLDQSRKYLIKSAAQCKTASDVWEAVSNYYACTIASDWGGQMRPAVVDGALLNRRVTTWFHQMSIIGRWRHKTLGKLFYVLNSWGPNTHGKCPSGAPPGGFWITEKDMDYIAKQGETFAFSQFQGFPAQNFKWTT